jgi:glycerol-3-phosphate O-acyltransferase
MSQSEKDKSQKKYKPILPGTKDWPVVQLSRNRKQFIDYVTQTTVDRMLAAAPNRDKLREDLETTLYLEKLRYKKNPWKVDPPDEAKFWSGVKHDLVDLSSSKNVEKKAYDILYRIVDRYSNEIAGNFRKSYYKMAREIVKFGFARLLNATRVKRFGAFFRNEYTLRDSIQITGKVKQLRKLAQQGTIVMVPTHFSNLDSILIGWIIHALGLPAFIYGAGLNLFNIKIFAYFMNSLGAYKVDRRKKNPIYLETLKTYSTLAIQEGAHSLFFPGGTRSRSGKIETSLKLGLLGTAMEAQRSLFMENPNGEARKIFIVPVTINYNFVLEAPTLIRQYLERKGQERFYQEADEFSTSYKITRFLVKFFSQSSDVSVSIGAGLDLLGNEVDKQGRSIDAQGRFINTRDYFMSNGEMNIDTQREAVYTKQLADKIVSEYHRINRVFASHLVAFVAFQIWRRTYKKLNLYDFLRIPEEELVINYDEFRNEFKRALKAVFKLKKKGKVNIADHLKADIDDVIAHGLDSVGMYHASRPLIKNKQGDIITQDLTTLYYYHNRMDGYDLEELFS